MHVELRGGGDTQALLAGKKLNFMHSQAVGTQKLVLALVPHTSHEWNFHYLMFGLVLASFSATVEVFSNRI